MSSFEKIYFAIIGLIFLSSIIYWGNLAWFHPDKLKTRLMKRAQRHPDWLFLKGYSLKYSEKNGVLLFRLVTLVGTLILLVSGILVSLGLLGIIK